MYLVFDPFSLKDYVDVCLEFFDKADLFLQIHACADAHM